MKSHIESSAADCGAINAWYGTRQVKNDNICASCHKILRQRREKTKELLTIARGDTNQVSLNVQVGFRAVLLSLKKLLREKNCETITLNTFQWIHQPKTYIVVSLTQLSKILVEFWFENVATNGLTKNAPSF